MDNHPNHLLSFSLFSFSHPNPLQASTAFDNKISKINEHISSNSNESKICEDKDTLDNIRQKIIENIKNFDYVVLYLPKKDIRKQRRQYQVFEKEFLFNSSYQKINNHLPLEVIFFYTFEEKLQILSRIFSKKKKLEPSTFASYMIYKNFLTHRIGFNTNTPIREDEYANTMVTEFKYK